MSNKVTSINAKGMITIPSEIRKKYNLIPGDKCKILDLGDEIIIIPLNKNYLDKFRTFSSKEYKNLIEKLNSDEISLENEI
ncbi:MAG: AbrB/MazE/SpoVT family DNA-binding domain-containing protein [Candidatus Lokiarchaeota archaeon]|nr:AbrB/MazE/SpoVT family DNA-binding domain-containing protein [Candidatus Harpocratesius repetitus]